MEVAENEMGVKKRVGEGRKERLGGSGRKAWVLLSAPWEALDGVYSHPWGWGGGGRLTGILGIWVRSSKSTNSMTIMHHKSFHI
jgi:hypothetical protein